VYQTSAFSTGHNRRLANGQMACILKGRRSGRVAALVSDGERRNVSIRSTARPPGIYIYMSAVMTCTTTLYLFSYEHRRSVSFYNNYKHINTGHDDRWVQPLDCAVRSSLASAADELTASPRATLVICVPMVTMLYGQSSALFYRILICSTEFCESDRACVHSLITKAFRVTPLSRWVHGE